MIRRAEVRWFHRSDESRFWTMRSLKKFTCLLRVVACIAGLAVVYSLVLHDSSSERCNEATAISGCRAPNGFQLKNRRIPYSCETPVKNVVAPKVHRCASTTLRNIYTTFGMRHKLNVVVARHDDSHVGYPESLRPEHVIQLRDGEEYNIFSQHFVYNRTTLRKLMPADTMYIGALRDPFKQFVSSICGLHRTSEQLNLDSDNKVAQFLHKPEVYEKEVDICRIPGRLCGRKSITLNFMATDFGFDNRWAHDTQTIEAFVEMIDKDFDLVLITDYFLESLILLRRTLHWSIKDIIFNSGHVPPKAELCSEHALRHEAELREIHLNYSKVDWRLFHHFNKTFWEKINEQYSDFHGELAYFRDVIRDAKSYCQDVRTPDDAVSVAYFPGTKWCGGFNVTQSDCVLWYNTPSKTLSKMIRTYMSPKLNLDERKM